MIISLLMYRITSPTPSPTSHQAQWFQTQLKGHGGPAVSGVMHLPPTARRSLGTEAGFPSTQPLGSDTSWGRDRKLLLVPELKASLPPLLPTPDHSPPYPPWRVPVKASACQCKSAGFRPAAGDGWAGSSNNG